MTIHTIIDEADLDPLLDAHDIVVIDFWAPWCPPCKEFVPVFEAAATRHPEMGFCRVNTQDAKPLSLAFDVASIPTLVVIRERIMIASQPGYLSSEKLDRLLEQVAALDMDELRREIAAAEKPAAENEG